MSYLFGYDASMGWKKAFGYGIHFERTSHGFATEGSNMFPWKGVITETIMRLSWSYDIISSDKHLLRIGKYFGYLQKQMDWTKLTFGDQISPQYGFIYERNETMVADTRGNLDFGVGIHYTFNGLYIGSSVLHITQPKEGFIDADKARLPMKLVANIGYNYNLNNRLSITPSLIYSKQQDFVSWNPNLKCSIKDKYLIALSFNNLNTLSFQGGIILKRRFMVNSAIGFTTEPNIRYGGSYNYMKFNFRYCLGDV